MNWTQNHDDALRRAHSSAPSQRTANAFWQSLAAELGRTTGAIQNRCALLGLVAKIDKTTEPPRTYFKEAK